MKQPPEVTKHLFRDIDVTVKRVEAFALDTREVQLKVLAILRERASEQGQAVEVSLISVFIAFTVSALAPRDLDTAALPLWALVVAGGAVGVGLILLVLPLLIPHALWVARHDRAVVWLAAFEDELERKRSQRGRRARAWKSTH